MVIETVFHDSVACLAHPALAYCMETVDFGLAFSPEHTAKIALIIWVLNMLNIIHVLSVSIQEVHGPMGI